MSKTKIEWCLRPGTKPEVWNPTTGCNKVSRGCKNCYAEVMHRRLMAMKPEKYSQPFLNGAVPHPPSLLIPLSWKTPRTVFVNSMSDLFHDEIPFDFIAQVWCVMKACPQHTFIILTKRPQNMLQFLTQKAVYKKLDDASLQMDELPSMVCYQQNGFIKNWPLPNVWLGVSDEGNQHQRIDILRQCPAAIKMVSFEPLICNPGEVDLTGINGVYVGGESGHQATPMHPDWATAILEQCRKYKTSFFFKQWGEYLPFEETAQAPFYRDCSDNEEYDAHGLNFYDAETDEPGKFSGCNWFDPMDAFILNGGCNQSVMYLKTGKLKAGRKFYGKEYNEQPA